MSGLPFNDLFPDIDFEPPPKAKPAEGGSDESTTVGPDGIVTIKMSTKKPEASKSGGVDAAGPPKEETGTSHVVKRGYGAFAGALGRYFEMARGMQTGETLPLAALRLFLPGEWVDKVSPQLKVEMPMPESFHGPREEVTLREALSRSSALNPENMKREAVMGAGRALNLLPGEDVPEGPTVGKAPGPVSKTLGTMAEFSGEALAMPATSGVNAGKYLMAAAGAGATSEAGGALARGTARAITDNPLAQDIAEAGGQLVGGVVGAPAYVVRGNAVGEAVKAPKTVYDRAAQAYKSAKERRAVAIKRGEDAKSVFSYFMDDYKHLSEAAKGRMQQHVMEQVANDIARDPEAIDSLEAFNEAARKAGADPDKFNIGQKTATPGLVATIESIKPTSREEVNRLATQARGSEREIERVYKNLVGETVAKGSATLQQSLQEYQKTQNLRLEVLNREAEEIASQAPKLSVQEKLAQGEKLYTLRDVELKAATERKNALYENAFKADEQANIEYDLSPMVAEVKDVLKDAFSKIDPSTVPDSIRNIRALFAKRQVPEWQKIVDMMDEPTKKWFTDEFLKSSTTAGAERISLREINAALVALNDDIHSAHRAAMAGNAGEAVKARNLTKIQQALENVIETQTGDAPEVLAAYNAAVDNFKTAFVPRFREGVNANLGKEAGTTKMGRDYIVPEKFVEAYLTPEPGLKQVTETQMREFDNLFGGKIEGTQKVEDAYSELARGLQDKYADDLLTKGAQGFSPERHDAFLRKYEAALDRVPELRQQLDSIADGVMLKRAEAERVAENFKDITTYPLTQRLGKEQSDALLATALSNPRKMGELISALGAGKGGEGAKALVKQIMLRATPWKETPDGMDYDPVRLLKLLDAGAARDGGPGGLKVAFRAAFGKAKGDEHLDNLRAIALLSQRQALTNPKFLRPSEPISQDILQGATGQTLGSHLTTAKAFGEGRVGLEYTAGVAIGRYFNTRLKAAFTKAQQDALFDPELGRAILDMATTNANAKLGKDTVETLRKQGGAMAEWAKKLTEHGMVGKHMFNAARITGTVMANRDEQDEEANKVRRYDEPAINR